MIPTLSNKKTINEDFEKFIKDLQIFADNYIAEVNNVILKHLDELYKEDSIRYILDKYISKKETYERFKKDYLLRAYLENKPVDKEEIYGRDVYELQNTLYLLCYRRFTEREEDKKANV